MEIEDIDKLVIKAIENDFNEKTISQIVFLYFKNDKKIIDCYEKIRIGISEEIFNLFMKIADGFNDNSKNYDECSKEWRENNLIRHFIVWIRRNGCQRFQNFHEYKFLNY